MIIAGIDWSMTSPAITIGDTDKPEFENLKLFAFQKDKKQFSGLNNLKLSSYPVFLNNQERFSKLAIWAGDILHAHGVKKVYLEGYSYGSAGKLAEIGESTGLLKHSLWQLGIDFEVLAPTTIKKQSIGNGKANKFQMEEAFRQKESICMSTMLGSKFSTTKLPNPVTDLVDSYWIWQCGKQLIAMSELKPL